MIKYRKNENFGFKSFTVEDSNPNQSYLDKTIENYIRNISNEHTSSDVDIVDISIRTTLDAGKYMQQTYHHVTIFYAIEKREDLKI